MTQALRFSLWAQALPDRLHPEQTARRFSLPGAQDLSRFAGLLGLPEEDAPDEEKPKESAQAASVPFPIPALLPEDVSGEVRLTSEIRFDRLCGDHAQLEFRLLCGRGSVQLGGEAPVRFENEPLSLHVTDALRLGRRQTLTIRFDDTRPAGVPGAVLLHVARMARIEFAGIEPDAAAGTMTLRARVSAMRDGHYRLSAFPCPADGAQAAANPPAARELPFALKAGMQREISLTIDAPGERFLCGRPYAAPSLRLELTHETETALPIKRQKKRSLRLLHGRTKAPAPGTGRLRTRCDSMTLMYGYPGQAPEIFVPLSRKTAALPPEQLVEQLNARNLRAVSLPGCPSDVLCAACLRAGISLRLRPPKNASQRARLARFPCVTFFADPLPEPPSPEENAWQLGSMTGLERHADPGSVPAELLAEAAGRPIDAGEESVAAVLQWLRAVRIRLLAEAGRQGRYSGPLCSPQESDQPDIVEALATALAGMHLSALPLRGAWWTGSHFSASLVACIDALPETLRRSAEPLRASALLETECGDILARLDMPCALSGGPIGMLEARLPDEPCVLTLTARLLLGDAILEQSALPVYVGERGVLEAAFAPMAALHGSS